MVLINTSQMIGPKAAIQAYSELLYARIIARTIRLKYMIVFSLHFPTLRKVKHKSVSLLSRGLESFGAVIFSHENITAPNDSRKTHSRPYSSEFSTTQSYNTNNTAE